MTNTIRILSTLFWSFKKGKELKAKIHNQVMIGAFPVEFLFKSCKKLLFVQVSGSYLHELGLIRLEHTCLDVHWLDETLFFFFSDEEYSSKMFK